MVGKTLIAGTSGNDSLQGTAGSDDLYGLGGDDALYGNGGNDALNGGGGDDLLDGGQGSDSMTGGSGNDHYVVDNVGDMVFEFSGGGIDSIESSVNWDMMVRSNQVEALYLTGFDNLTGRGTNADNVILGNDGDNVLRGEGGNDTMSGGAGHDTLYGGSGNDDLTGDAQDQLAGGTGNDTYTIDAGGKIVENAGEGHDSVFLNASESQSTTFNVWNNVEDLTVGASNAQTITVNGNGLNNSLHGYGGAYAFNGGAGNDDLQGGFMADHLNGGGGNGTLNGDGGNDVLTGGAGADRFFFGAPTPDSTEEVPTDAGVDTVVDFSHGVDRFALDSSFYTGLQAGDLSADAFCAGSAAADGNDRILYDSHSGALYYDCDGNGSTAQVQFAVVQNHATVDQHDFVIV